MVIESFTPDRHKIVFKEVGDEHPDIDVDDVIACAQVKVQILEPEQATEPSQSQQQSRSLLVKLSLLETECAMQTIRQTGNKSKAQTPWHSR